MLINQQRHALFNKRECERVLKSETPYKGIERLKRDGGWFHFASIEEAEDYCKSWQPNRYIVRRGRCCFT